MLATSVRDCAGYLALCLVASLGASACDEESKSGEVAKTQTEDEQTEDSGPTQTPTSPAPVNPVVPSAQTQTPTDAAAPVADPATPSVENDATAPAPVADAGAAAPLDAGSQPTLQPIWPPPRSGGDAGSEPASEFAHQEVCFERSRCGLALVTASAEGVTYDADATRCILEEMAGALTGSYGHRHVDATGETVDTYFLTHPFWLAQVSTRQTFDERDAGVDTFGRYLCQFAPNEFLTDCLAELPEGQVTVPTLPPCANPAFWFSACANTPTPDTQCPSEP